MSEDQFRQQSQTMLGRVRDKVVDLGVTNFEITYGVGQSLTHSRRMGKPEDIDRSESSGIGLRVLMGHRQASVRSNDYSDAGLSEMVERAVAMAKVVPEDQWVGLASPEELADSAKLPFCDGVDEEWVQDETLIERAKLAEEAVLSVPLITNSEGVAASWSFSRGAVLASNGFFAVRSSSRHSLSVSAIAGQGLEMEGDYYGSSSVYGQDLLAAETVGTIAAKRAIARLNPRKIKSGSFPILYDKRISSALLSSLAGAINGASIAKGTSFLMDKLGQAIFKPSITIIDDPHRLRGLASRAFDAEGLPTKKQALVDKGMLTSWILDLASARQLGMPSNGMAGRNGSGLPQACASNLYLEAGSLTPQELLKNEPCAVIVTNLMGMGVNMVTGDYSQGAGGFWVEYGEIIHPVNDATIAGNLHAMFAELSAANDLEFDHAFNAPSLRIDGMTIAS